MSDIMNWIKDWVYNIAVFLILISLVEIIMPHKNFKKYIKLILGLVFLLIVVEPIFVLLGADSYLEFKMVDSNLHVEQESIKSQLDYYNSKQQEIAKEQISNILLSQVKSILDNNNIYVIDGKIICAEGENGFGEIESIDVLVTDIPTEVGEDNMVKPIMIDNIDINDGESIEPKDNKNILLENKVITVLSDYYMISKDIIKVTVYDDEVNGE